MIFIFNFGSIKSILFYTRAEIYQKFSQANGWSKNKLPNLSATLPNLKRKIKSTQFNFLNFLNREYFWFFRILG